MPLLSLSNSTHSLLLKTRHHPLFQPSTHLSGHRITSLASLVWPVNLDRCFGNTPDASHIDPPPGTGDKTKIVQLKDSTQKKNTLNNSANNLQDVNIYDEKWQFNLSQAYKCKAKCVEKAWALIKYVHIIILICQFSLITFNCYYYVGFEKVIKCSFWSDVT